MVAIITGVGLGLERSSASLLGSQGQIGQASLGASGENVYVNAASGALIDQRTDEILTGVGLDDDVVRTYDSQSTYTANRLAVQFPEGEIGDTKSRNRGHTPFFRSGN